MFESLKGWIIDPNTQAQKTIENYENQRLSLEDAIESGLLNNRAGQIFLDYGDVIMGPPVTLPSSLVGIREAIKGNFDSKEMQRTATAGFYAGFVGQGIEYTQIISNADYQLSMIITSAKGVNSINNPLSYLLFIKDFSLTQTIDAAKAGLQDVWNGTYDSAIGRKIGAGTFNYLLMTIGGAQLKGKGTACEAVESGTTSSKGGNDSILALPAPSGTNPWLEKSDIVSMPAPDDCYIDMALAPGQNKPGGWGTLDSIPDVDYVRNSLAVTPEFKPEVGYVQRYKIPKGVRIQVGTVGPQQYKGKIYVGGGNQVQILNFKDRAKLIPIGKKRPIY